MDKAEAALNRAVALSPNEWECWTIRAKVLLTKSQRILGVQQFDLQSGPGLEVIETGIREGKITEPTVGRAKELCDEAFGCLDQAVEVAPKKREVWFTRSGNRTLRLPIEFAQCCIRGVTFSPPGFVERFGRDNLLDLRRASEKLPDDFRVMGSLACLELSLSRISFEAVALDFIRPLSAEARKTIRRAIGLLRKVAAGENLRDAIDAAELLGIICSCTTEPADAEVLLDQLLLRNPSLDGAWDTRYTLAKCRRAPAEEVLSMCRNRLRHKDSSRNRFMLARAYEASQMPAEALRVLEDGLQKEPNDFLCNLGVAVLLTKRDGPNDLNKAKQANVRAMTRLQLPRDSSKLFECQLLQIANSALAGRNEQVVKSLTMAEGMGWNEEQMEKLRQVAGPQPLPGPPGIGITPADFQPK